MNIPAHFPKTLTDAIVFFANPDNAHDVAARLVWPDGEAVCAHCGAKGAYFLAKYRRYSCKACRKQFTVKMRTIFEDSPVGLDKWLTAIWMISNCKNGISSWEIHRDLGVTQKTAWFLLHRIRLAMQAHTFQKLSGEVEVDESYIGGKARNMHAHKRREKIKGRGMSGKTAVMGLLERHGHVRTKVVGNVKRKTLAPEVRANVEPGSEVFTDALKSYDGLSADYIHQVIDHAEKYVDGNVHTNCIENFWCLLKRGLKGTYVSVEPYHLFRYLDEQAFRYNFRKLTDAERFIMVGKQVAGKRVTYKELIGEGEGLQQ